MADERKTTGCDSLLRVRETYWIETRREGETDWTPWSESEHLSRAESEIARLRAAHPHLEWRLGRKTDRVEVLDA
jgi:hypothetical protein